MGLKGDIIVNSKVLDNISYYTTNNTTNKYGNNVYQVQSIDKNVFSEELDIKIGAR